MAKTYVNKLSDVLNAFDCNDKEFFKNLTEVQQKDLSKNMWLLMKYCSGVDNKRDLHYLIMTHELVNCDFAKMTDHPGLNWQLMALCGAGFKQFHFLPPPAGSVKRNKKYDILAKVFPEYNEQEIDILLSGTDRDEIIDWCEMYGFEEKDIAKYF